MLETNIFQRALQAIDEQFADHPLVQARLLQAVASTTHSLGLLDMANAPQERALAIQREHLGDNHQDTLSSLE